MMQDFAMHILDLAHNSIRANAKTLDLRILEDPNNDRFEVELRDDGCGMDEDMLKKARDPFYTTRTTRKIGLGIPLFEGTATQCQGEFTLRSVVNQGTRISASMKYSHIDRPPLGDLGLTVAMILQANPKMRFRLDYTYEKQKFRLDSEEIQATLGDDVTIDEPEILLFIQDYVREHIKTLQQGGKSE